MCEVITSEGWNLKDQNVPIEESSGKFSSEVKEALSVKMVELNIYEAVMFVTGIALKDWKRNPEDIIKDTLNKVFWYTDNLSSSLVNSSGIRNKLLLTYEYRILREIYEISEEYTDENYKERYEKILEFCKKNEWLKFSLPFGLNYNPKQNPKDEEYDKYYHKFAFKIN